MVATKHQEVHKYQRVIDPKNVAAKIYSSLFSSLFLSLSLSVATAVRIRTQVFSRTRCLKITELLEFGK